MSIKVAQNDFIRKMIDFDSECGKFGQINCCQRLLKVAQSPINRPIWSHWLRGGFVQIKFEIGRSFSRKFLIITSGHEKMREK